MRFSAIVLALMLLVGCDANHYVYPEFVAHGELLCSTNEGVATMVITNSTRPGFLTSGAHGLVICNNTARFNYHIVVGE